jgi:hypothetical protein
LFLTRVATGAGQGLALPPPTGRSLGTASLGAGADDPGDEQLFNDADRGEASQGEQPDESPIGRLRARRSYWAATMRHLGMVCALTLSVLDSGYRLEWNPLTGPPPARWLRNHPSAFELSDFVSEKVSEGISLCTMRACSRTDLVCILPLGVAVNAAGKLRLIWDGRHVNSHLPHHKFRMETLQREGRSLFERSGWGGTVDISAAYHHLEMHPGSIPFLGFEWKGAFYCFVVLPFGLSTAPWLFTTVMGHCANFLRSSTGPGIGLLRYLDDLIFAASTAREALRSAMVLLGTLRKFGWLIHPRKCQGVSEALQSFTALGTLVNLATQTYSIPTATVDRILHALGNLATGPPEVPVRQVARVKGLLSATWLSTGIATRIRTRALSSVVDSRPGQGGMSKRECRRSWAALVPLTSAARDEIRWWQQNLCTINGLPIRPRPFDKTVDSSIFSDASDTGVGASLSAEGHTGPASSLVSTLLEQAPLGMTVATTRATALSMPHPFPFPCAGQVPLCVNSLGWSISSSSCATSCEEGPTVLSLTTWDASSSSVALSPPSLWVAKHGASMSLVGPPTQPCSTSRCKPLTHNSPMGFPFRQCGSLATSTSEQTFSPTLPSILTTDTPFTKPCFNCLMRSGGHTLSTASLLQATDCCPGSAPASFTLKLCGQMHCR